MASIVRSTTIEQDTPSLLLPAFLFNLIATGTFVRPAHATLSESHGASACDSRLTQTEGDKDRSLVPSTRAAMPPWGPPSRRAERAGTKPAEPLARGP